MSRTLVVMSQNNKVIGMMKYPQAVKRFQSKVLGMMKYLLVIKRNCTKLMLLRAMVPIVHPVVTLCYQIAQHPMMRWRRSGKSTRISRARAKAKHHQLLPNSLLQAKKQQVAKHHVLVKVQICLQGKAALGKAKGRPRRK